MKQRRTFWVRRFAADGRFAEHDGSLWLARNLNIGDRSNHAVHPDLFEIFDYRLWHSAFGRYFWRGAIVQVVCKSVREY